MPLHTSINCRQEGCKPHLVLLNDVQQCLLYRASHVGGITTHVEVSALLQQLPHQLPALPQPVLHVHLPGLQQKCPPLQVMPLHVACALTELTAPMNATHLPDSVSAV